MIDTIVLVIPNAQSVVWEKDNFNPSLKGVAYDIDEFAGRKLFLRYICNITPSKRYFPRLTVIPRYKRFGVVETPLKIEFSVPKLLYENNLDEVEENDFDQVVSTLQSRLAEMGVRVFKAQIENALVSTVHFSKNIVLTEYYTASFVLQRLSKLEVNKKLEVNHRHFKNEGNAIYFDCGSYQLVLYDKVRDMNKNLRHSVDKDRTSTQLDLFQVYKELKTEILRFELRFTRKQKLNSMLSKLGFSPNPNFKAIFSNQISKAMMLSQWNILKSDRNLFLLRFNEEDDLKQVIDFQKQHKLKLTSVETFALSYLLHYSQREGMRNLKDKFLTLYTSRTWFRLKKYFDYLEKMSASKRTFGFVRDIEQAFEDFIPYKTVSEVQSKREEVWQ